jgi:hypothetical protein
MRRNLLEGQLPWGRARRRPYQRLTLLFFQRVLSSVAQATQVVRPGRSSTYSGPACAVYWWASLLPSQSCLVLGRTKSAFTLPLSPPPNNSGRIDCLSCEGLAWRALLLEKPNRSGTWQTTFCLEQALACGGRSNVQVIWAGESDSWAIS